MRLQESPSWSFSSSSLPKSLPSGGGLTLRVSRRPPGQGPCPCLGSVTSHSGTVPPAGPCWLGDTARTHRGCCLMCQQRFSSHCPAAVAGMTRLLMLLSDMTLCVFVCVRDQRWPAIADGLVALADIHCVVQTAGRCLIRPPLGKTAVPLFNRKLQPH